MSQKNKGPLESGNITGQETAIPPREMKRAISARAALVAFALLFALYAWNHRALLAALVSR